MDNAKLRRLARRPLHPAVHGVSMIALAATAAIPAVANAQAQPVPLAPQASTNTPTAAPAAGSVSVAQPAAGSPASGAPPASAADLRAAQLGDIVVTARRVSERLQDIPASVSVVDSATVARMSSLDNLQNAVAGVTFKSFGPIPTVGIRGFGNRTNTQGPNSTVGIFQDGVFIAPFLNALDSRIDVARIEVAKGPQGTLYGRSSYTGAINIVTNDPTPTPSGYVEAGIGGSSSHGEMLWHARGVLSGPITNTLSARIFLFHEKRDGFTYDPNTKFRGFGYDRSAARLKLKWDPSDDVTIKLAGTLMHDNATRGEVHSGELQPPLGGRALLGNPFVPATYLNASDIWETSLIRKPLGKVNGQEVTLDARYRTPIGEFAWLTDYTHSDTNMKSSPDVSTRNVADAYVVSAEKRFSQELRLSGKADRLSYLAGLYYLYTDFNLGRYSNTQIDQNGPFAVFYPGSLLYDIVRVQAVYSPADTKTKAYAAFAQLGYDITERLNFTGGIRFARDDLSGSTRSSNLLRTGALVTTVPPTFRKARYDALTGSANLSYKFAPESLVYVSYSRGDAPGGFNNGAAALIQFAPQKVNAYELGVKSEFLDRHVRFNAALFQNDYTNLQTFQSFLIGGVATQVTVNAAKARGRGIDLDAAIVINDNWRVTGNYTHQTSKITAYTVPPPPAPQVNYNGSPLVRSPKDALNGALTYTQHLGAARLQLVAEESYTSSYTNDYTGVPAGTAYPGRPGVAPGVTTSQVIWLIPTPGYATTNLSASLTIHHWELSAYVRNLFNKQYIVAAAGIDPFSYPLEVPGEPRTFEVSAKYAF